MPLKCVGIKGENEPRAAVSEALRPTARVSSDGAAGPRLSNNQLYKFSYMTEVLLDSARGPKETPTGYRISSNVGVHLVWRDPSSKDDQLIQLAVRRCTPRRRPLLPPRTRAEAFTRSFLTLSFRSRT